MKKEMDTYHIAILSIMHAFLNEFVYYWYGKRNKQQKIVYDHVVQS